MGWLHAWRLIADLEFRESPFQTLNNIVGDNDADQNVLANEICTYHLVERSVFSVIYNDDLVSVPSRCFCHT